VPRSPPLLSSGVDSGGEMGDKYSIRESEGDKVVGKNVETDKEGMAADKKGNTKSCSEGVRRMTQTER